MSNPHDFIKVAHNTACSRRICPGMYVAEREIWLAVSRLLWCFGIRPLPSEPICLDNWEGKSGRTPMPFRIYLEPRHENVASILSSDNKGGMHLQGSYYN